jgi:hypothetical protein
MGALAPIATSVFLREFLPDVPWSVQIAASWASTGLVVSGGAQVHGDCRNLRPVELLSSGATLAGGDMQHFLFVITGLIPVIPIQGA